MEQGGAEIQLQRDAAAEYLSDMLVQMAKLARGIGQLHVAVLLEAVIAVQRDTERHPSEH